MAERGYFLVLDKPKGLSSRAVVDRVVRRAGTRRVGHAGTLDPLASGVLVVALGAATRLVEYVQRMQKTYRADIRLGASSPTDDLEGPLTLLESAPFPRADLSRILSSFVGTIAQRPPAYSAISTGGQRAYKLARKGRAPKLEPRPVTIHDVRLLDYCHPTLRIEVRCGAGTYIRALARDLGEAAGTGGVLTELCRTAIGPFTLAEALTLEDLERDDWREHCRPLLDGLGHLPQVRLDGPESISFLQGKRLVLTVDLRPRGEGAEEVGVIDASGSLLGIGRYNTHSGVLAPAKAGFTERG